MVDDGAKVTTDQKDVTPKKVPEMRLASKISKAKLFDIQRKKLITQLTEKDLSATSAVAKRRSEQKVLDAKAKGLLKLMDSSMSVAGRADTIESRDVTPPRINLISKHASMIAMKSSNH